MRMNSNAKTAPHIIIIIIPNCFPNLSTSFWKGLGSITTSCNFPAILPISVFIPVPITIPSPFPLVTIVFIYPRLVLSAKIIFSSTISNCF
ncbi:hypothetical protein ES702_06262 [subsurface metagenome]